MVVPFPNRPARTSSSCSLNPSSDSSLPPSTDSLTNARKIDAIAQKNATLGAALTDLVNRLYSEVS